MRARILINLALAVVACSAATALAADKKGKVAAVPRLNVFSPMVYALEPNIEAILVLTDDQKDKVGKAVQETVRAQAVVDLQPKKGEPAD